MKIVYILAISILFIHLTNSQIMHTEKELEEFKDRVTQTRRLGRETIISIAVKRASDDPESLMNDKNVIISVWYNDAIVKVEFREHFPIKYLPYASEYFSQMTVEVSVDRVSGFGGSMIDNYENDTSGSIYDDAFLYRATKEHEAAIDLVLKLNNTNDSKYHIDRSTQRNITIREKKNHYAIQLGNSYSITYKIHKKSGKIYDYEDPYRDFYPTHMIPPEFIPVGGKWIEMKE